MFGTLLFTYMPVLTLDGSTLRCNRGIFGHDEATFHPTGANVSVSGETLAVRSESGPLFTFNLFQLDAADRDQLHTLIHGGQTSPPSPASET